MPKFNALLYLSTYNKINVNNSKYLNFMKTKVRKVRSALLRACSAGFMLVMVIMAMVLPTGCADELKKAYPTGDTVTIFKELYWLSERTGLASVAVKDTLVKSDVSFRQSSTLVNEKEDVQLMFNPTAYLNVRLSKQRIDVRSENEIPVTLVKEQMVSRVPYKKDTEFGEDVVKNYEFSDGQVATVSYGWRYTGIVVGSDTLAAPHVEITSVAFNKQLIEAFGQKSETEDPYKSILAFVAQYVIKGVSGNEIVSETEMRPWYHKVITSEATKVIRVDYVGKYLGCPVSAYELTEKVITNKNEFTNTYKVNLSMNIAAPNLREQPSLDSLFSETSKGKMAEKAFSEIKNNDGFTIRTMTGSYVSSNTGREARTAVESTISFTYETPVKFESEYGSYAIEPLKLEFEEDGFEVMKISENEEFKLFKSVNSVQGSIGTCLLDVIDEVVNLRVQKDKAPDVAKVDSVYTLKGEGDNYIVDKTIIWSDGSKTSSTYEYKGRHSASALAFGEKVTSSLNWNESTLQRASQSKENDEKKFSATTKFTVVYTTSDWKSNATNGSESGTFLFKETSPVVTFVDGKITKVFPERKYTLTGLGATIASSANTMVVNGVTYNAYAYEYTTKAVWNGNSEPDLISKGYLLMAADTKGTPTYTYNQTWNGNTTTVTVTKTTPHSHADDEVETFTKKFTVSLGGLTDGKVYADNTSFATSETYNETNTKQNDSPWTVVSYKRNYVYTLSNGVVARNDLKVDVVDAVITFNDGNYQHEFNVRLNVTKSERFGNVRGEGNYAVTPHILTVNGATVDGKQLSSSGTTDIYVKSQEPEQPHFGKPLGFTVTATYDPATKVTRRAFVFNWENGVTYAVCDYETALPKTSDFMFKESTYSGYNSVGYDKDNSSNHWQPARGSDDSDAIRWYRSNGGLMSGIDKSAGCMVIGWKNIVDGKYALVIPGYTYTISGYNITVKAPNGQTVTFNSHYEK